jgi:hypothetical protein
MLSSGLFNVQGVAFSVAPQHPGDVLAPRGDTVAVNPNPPATASTCAGWLTALIALASLSACVTPPIVLEHEVGPQPARANGATDGHLVVYSATYAPTVEQSEYPVHTNYTIATLDDRPIRQVRNATGSFESNPAKVSLPAGEYHVRAQYTGGRFIVVPVVIERNRTTVVDLDSEAVPQRTDASGMVRLPDGHVVGWRATSPANSP